jgi:hypothetical protein
MTWPTEKLTALRLGRPLATEVPGTGAGRRAFVTISPNRTPGDDEAEREGWTRPDRNRTYTLQHWDYEAAAIEGWDFDIGSILLRDQTVTGEAAMTTTIEEWGLHPEDFRYYWQTAAPR